MHIKEFLLLPLLGGLLYLHTGPYAHGMFAMGGGILVLLLIGVYAGFAWNEFPRDEREEYVHGKAHKIGFLCALLVLVVGITTQYVMGDNDVWLLATLIALLAGKSVGSLIADR